ncbi:hypothetical protein [Pedobacter sp. UBA5917]|jgi:hypothetical protein|uniref:hypothetical protein n=1 Tax=Pedobacter sp. UBA5917 TaxID=1947061 RepID=UPI0025D33155|nr:hypothetical protein [Pedobacter sp. UBA5917]
MESTHKRSLSRFLVAIVSMLSMLFLITPPFERNVQQCEMIREIGRKKKSGFQLDGEME